MPADRRRVRVALGVLLVIAIAVNGAAFVLYSRSLSGIRGDFCAYTQDHYTATLELPQVHARQLAEESDVKLLRQLGCGRG
jgi:hypothetical protein